MVWTLLEILDTLSITDSRQGQENILSSSVLADGMLCMTRIDAASYLWCQSNARLCNWAFDPDTRMKPELCSQEADAGLIVWGSLNTRLCWAQSVDTQYTIFLPGSHPISCCHDAVTVRNSALATNWVVNIGPYYILQPPPLLSQILDPCVNQYRAIMAF